MTYINLFLISAVICFIVDISGFFDFVRKFVASRMENRYKNLTADDIKIPFVTCSLCSVWWAGLIYLIIAGEFTIVNIAYVALLSLCSSNISGFLLSIKDLLAWIEMKFQKLIEEN